jgi:hypothetical protein
VKFLNSHAIEEMPTQENVIDSITDPRKLPYHLLDDYGGKRSERRYQSLRLSEIDGACPREWVLGHLMDLYFYQNIPISNLWQMNMGSILHWYIQNDPAFFGDKLVGWWKCRACGFMRRFGTRPKEPCEKCHGHPRVTEYDEYMFRIKTPYRVVGKIDLILRVAPRVYRYGEIKTCSKDMTSPDGGHVAQTASYNYFSRYDDKLPITIDRSTCYIFYFNKKFDFKGPVKTFTLKPTTVLINPLKAKAGMITEGINNKTLPDPLTTCINVNFSSKSGRPKKCGIPKECKKQFEAGVTVIGV